MGLGATLANAASAGLAGAVTGGIGSIVSGGLGLLSGLFKKNNNGLKNQQKLMQQAWEYEKEGMGLQYNYGQQAADAEYKRNLQMWKETNFGAQRDEMEKAGLSVGLMYGNGGGQAASTAGGDGMQPSGPKMNRPRGGLGLLGGLFKRNNNGFKNQQKLMQQAWEYEKEGMGLQYSYGQQAADAEYKRTCIVNGIPFTSAFGSPSLLNAEPSCSSGVRGLLEIISP